MREIIKDAILEAEVGTDTFSIDLDKAVDYVLDTLDKHFEKVVEEFIKIRNGYEERGRVSGIAFVRDEILKKSGEAYADWKDDEATQLRKVADMINDLWIDNDQEFKIEVLKKVYAAEDVFNALLNVNEGSDPE